MIYVYAKCGINHFLLGNNIQKTKGYFYLATKSSEVCFLLVEKGLETNRAFVNDIREKRNLLFYVQYAILANCRELALHIVSENSLLGVLLLKDYERAKGYLPDDVKEINSKTFLEQIMWAIVYFDEKKMNQFLEKRVKLLRRQAKNFTVIHFDSFGLALIKLAKERGLNCSINVIELPLNLLDDVSINKEEWRLPYANRLRQVSWNGMLN